MALWNGTEINNNLVANVFNQLYSYKAVEQVRKRNALYYAIIGKRDINDGDGSAQMPYKWERLERETGNKIQIKLLGALDDVNFVSSMAAQIAPITPKYNENKFGAAVFDLSHVADQYAVPSDEWNKIQGKEAATLSYIDEVFNSIQLSMEKAIGTGLNSAAAPAQGTIGGWIYAVSDGVTAGEGGFATYGTLNRADAGNIDYRSYVQPNAGELTHDTIRLVKNTVSVHGGSGAIAPAGVPLFTAIQGLHETYTIVENDGEWAKFGGPNFMYGNTRFIQDQYIDLVDSGTLGILDPESFAWWSNFHNFTSAGFIPAPHLTAARVLPWEWYGQLICIQPNKNGKITGIEVA